MKKTIDYSAAELENEIKPLLDRLMQTEIRISNELYIKSLELANE